MRTRHLPLLLWLFLLAVFPAPTQAAVTHDTRPAQHWELDFESGVLWKLGGRSTHLDYVLLPQLLTLRSPAHFRRALGAGELVLRARLSLLLEPIVQGPENYYVGATASGILEWWDAAARRALFFSSGGGLGLMDSRGYEVEGGQGQDLNFNWFIYTGARWQWREAQHLSLGLYFQHVSNTGLDPINPGIDALGPMISFGWRF